MELGPLLAIWAFTLLSITLPTLHLAAEPPLEVLSTHLAVVLYLTLPQADRAALTLLSATWCSWRPGFTDIDLTWANIHLGLWRSLQVHVPALPLTGQATLGDLLKHFASRLPPL